MHSFKHHLISEGHLPFIDHIIRYMDINGYSSAIINKASKIYNSNLWTQESINIGSFRILNHYTKKIDKVTIGVMFDKNCNGCGSAKSKTEEDGTIHISVMLNWPKVLKSYLYRGNVSLKTLINSMIQHELTHIVDPSSWIKSTRKYDIKKYKNDPLRSYLYKQTEVTARIRDVVTAIHNNLSLGDISISTLKRIIVKPDSVLISWLLSLKNSALDNTFLYYQKEHPDIIRRLRGILYNTFIKSEPAPKREPPQPVSR